MKKFIFLILIALVLSISACTDAQIAQNAGLGKRHKVTLYSCGQAIKSWTSTGAIQSEQASDGYFFMDEQTGGLIRVTGDVVSEVVN
jgi:hypothetical protein